MAPCCCLIFNLHYMAETQESMGFIQKKAVLTKDTIKDGVFTCLIKMNCNWKSKGGFGNASNCGLKKRLFRNLKVILLEDDFFGIQRIWLQFSRSVIRNTIIKLSSAYYCCDFHFADDLHRLMDLACSLDLGALETISKVTISKEWRQIRKVFSTQDKVRFGDRKSKDSIHLQFTQKVQDFCLRVVGQKIDHDVAGCKVRFSCKKKKNGYLFCGGWSVLEQTNLYQFSTGTVPKLTLNTDLPVESAEWT